MFTKNLSNFPKHDMEVEDEAPVENSFNETLNFEFISKKPNPLNDLNILNNQNIF